MQHVNRRALFAAAPMLGLASCATVMPPATVAAVHLGAGRALALAYAALDGSVLLVEASIKSHVLTGAAEQSAGADLVRAKSVLDGADKAYAASSQEDISGPIATVADIIQTIRTAVGK